MNQNKATPWHLLAPGRTRVVCGIMSGTSLDGADAVVARCEGSGKSLRLDMLGFGQAEYPPALRALLLANSTDQTSSVSAISQLNARLPDVYKRAVLVALDDASLNRSALDAIGNHGQTIHHVPDLTDCAGLETRSTLQIGDSAVLANLTGVPVVGDFRLPDMALGGQGAPLVPYFDYVIFGSDHEVRGLLNLGGIANLTTIPAGGGLDDVRAFDTGPANMVMDLVADMLFDVPFDDGGRLAAAGTVVEGALNELLSDRYFRQAPPKTTGRERFGEAYAKNLVSLVERHCPPAASRREIGLNAMATAAALTYRSIHLAYREHLSSTAPLARLIAAGGGTRNGFIMDRLASVFSPAAVETTDDYGIPSQCKESLCFAVLAHEFLNGVPTNVPSVTGASSATLLGKLALPLRGARTNM